MKITFSSFKDFVRRTDLVLFFLCLTAAIFSIVVVSSTSISIGDGLHFIIVQSFAVFIGVTLYFFFTLIDVDIFADRWPILLLAEVLFLLILIPFGVEINGNVGWINLRVISFQPTELVKIIYIVLCAKHLSSLKDSHRLNSVFSIVQLLGHFGILFLLIMVVSSDLGSALVFFFIFIILLFAAGVRLYWFFFGGAALAVLIPIAWTNFLSDRHKERILAPYDSSIDPNGFDVNYQPFLAKKALSSGRLTGTGLYQGTQTQNHYLTSQHADYVFASIGEELGLIGCLFVILLLSAIIIRCVVVGLHARNTFGMLICFGVAASLTFQTFINIGMSLGLTPVIGVTLPFISYGGSSMATCFMGVGLVSGVHYRPRPDNYGGGYSLYR